MTWKGLHQRHPDERRIGVADERCLAAERTVQRVGPFVNRCVPYTIEELDRRLAEAGFVPLHKRRSTG